MLNRPLYLRIADTVRKVRNTSKSKISSRQDTISAFEQQLAEMLKEERNFDRGKFLETCRLPNQ